MLSQEESSLASESGEKERALPRAALAVGSELELPNPSHSWAHAQSAERKSEHGHTALEPPRLTVASICLHESI